MRQPYEKAKKYSYSSAATMYLTTRRQNRKQASSHNCLKTNENQIEHDHSPIPMKHNVGIIDRSGGVVWDIQDKNSGPPPFALNNRNGSGSKGKSNVRDHIVAQVPDNCFMQLQQKKIRLGGSKSTRIEPGQNDCFPPNLCIYEFLVLVTLLLLGRLASVLRRWDGIGQLRSRCRAQGGDAVDGWR